MLQLFCVQRSKNTENAKIPQLSTYSFLAGSETYKEKWDFAITNVISQWPELKESPKSGKPHRQNLLALPSPFLPRNLQFGSACWSYC